MTYPQMTELENLQAAIDRVRDLHQPYLMGDLAHCVCHELEPTGEHPLPDSNPDYSPLGPARWPCATIRALEGDTA